jgi:hypothetical protein
VDKDLVAAPGDLTGDGISDVIAREAGEARLYAGSQKGPLRDSGRTYHRFADVDQLTGVGDFDGNGTNDLVGRDKATKKLKLYPGLPGGAFGGAEVLAPSWDYDLTEGVGDFDGDDRPDLIARNGSSLSLIPGTGHGLGTPTGLPGSWSSFDVVTGRGDATGDHEPDILARDGSTGVTYIYPGDGSGGVMPRLGGYSRFANLQWFTLAGRLVGERKFDIAGLNTGTGRLRLYANSGARNLGRTLDTGVDVSKADLLLNVGDWDRDGRGDVMTRDRDTGDLELRRGRAGGRLRKPIVAAEGWDKLTRVAPVGDVTGDGFPDLMARTPKGSYRVYPGDGRHGFGKSVFAHRSSAAAVQLGLGRWTDDNRPDSALLRRDGTLWLWPTGGAAREQLATDLLGYDWVRGLGDVNGDHRPDVVAREASTGYLWLIPGLRDGFGSRRLIGTGFDAYDLG